MTNEQETPILPALRKMRAILLIMLAQTGLSLLVAHEHFALAAKRLATAAPASLAERLFQALGVILSLPIEYPVRQLAKTSMPLARLCAGPLAPLPEFLNSLLWGACLYYCGALILRRWKRGPV